jgi:hypothetical protein
MTFHNSQWDERDIFGGIAGMTAFQIRVYAHSHHWMKDAKAFQGCLKLLQRDISPYAGSSGEIQAQGDAEAGNISFRAGKFDLHGRNSFLERTILEADEL